MSKEILSRHSDDKERVSVRLDIVAVFQGVKMIEGGIRVKRMGWIQKGLTIIKNEIDRSVQMEVCIGSKEEGKEVVGDGVDKRKEDIHNSNINNS